MKRTITRRDFLDGIALSMAATAVAPYSALALAAAGKDDADYYPPLLNGMRGSHEGSFEVAHALVMNGQRPAAYERVDDVYDLVVVGGGISGLAAAYLYRKQMGPDAKILVLDNHDDFGGHAKRNEFRVDGKMLLSFGGSVNLEQATMGPAAYQLLEEVGVEFKTLQDAGAADYALSNGEAPFGLYLGKDLYGEDQVIAGPWGEAFAGAGDYRSMIGSLNLPADGYTLARQRSLPAQQQLRKLPARQGRAFQKRLQAHRALGERDFWRWHRERFNHGGVRAGCARPIRPGAARFCDAARRNRRVSRWQCLGGEAVCA